jgi:flagellar biosynthesis chaperone FliJ
MTQSGYTYGLAALRRLETWRRDELANELSGLKSEHAQKLGEEKEIGALIHALEGKLTSLLEEQPMFWIETREAVTSFLVEQRDTRERVRDELSCLSFAIRDVADKVVEKRQSERILQRHYERGLGRFLDEGQRQDAKVSDDLWLNKFVRFQAGMKHEN